MKIPEFEFLQQILEVLEALPRRTLPHGAVEAWLRAWNYDPEARRCLTEHAEAVADLAAVEAQWWDNSPHARWHAVRRWLLERVPPVPRF